MTEAVLLNISDMIDLAIGTPEVGVVDFNMLQTVLHCLAQQLHVLNKNVELRGSMAVLPLGRDNGHTVAISEFAVDTDDKVTSVPAPTPAEPKTETLLVVERVKKGDSRNATTPKVTTTESQGVVPRAGTSLDKLSLVTMTKFNLLESVVEDLKNRVYGSIPKNEDILKDIRSQTNLKAITDMWTSLNVSSRLEAAEEGIGKLSSLVQDLISESSGMQDLLKKHSFPAIAAAPTDSATPPQSPAPASSVDALPTDKPSTLAGLPNSIKGEFDTFQKHLDNLRADLNELTNNFYKTMEQLQAAFEATPAAAAAIAEALDATPAPSRAEEIRPPEHETTERRHSFTSTDLMNRINELETKLNKCCDSIGKVDDVVNDQIQSFQDQLEYLMKQVAELTQDLSAGKVSPDLVKDLQGLMQLFQTVQEMQDQMQQVHETALQLAAEKEDRQHNLNALLEQIEFLKTVKMDREDILEAMAEKADLRMLARKVSHDQFEMACDDLSKGLEHALGKLNLQEALWQQALDDIQREIETKLDKMELSPVKDFFNSKLKQLQENLKQIASLRREAEAAGTKRKLLRDVKCISCDAKAVMAMENETLPVPRPLPATLSMKPYLSYELDAIRKAQQTNLQQRNMHDWEQIDKQFGQNKPPPPQKAKSDTHRHLCNRYCGGSHTVTTPAQRVARLGHFIRQWGPDVVPLSSGLAAGDDGKLYKVSTGEGANVGPGGAVPDSTCTPRPGSSKHEKQAKPPPKPIIISAECRCLEGEDPKKY